MKQVVITGRLSLRELNENDASFIIALLNTPSWLQFIGDRNVSNEAQAISYIQNGPQKSYAENGFGLYLVERKEGITSLGICGLIKREELECVDIGFAFLPEFEGMGYAYEAASAIMDLAQNKLNIKIIFAITNDNNVRSIRLLHKLGFRFLRLHESPTKEMLMLFTNSN